MLGRAVSKYVDTHAVHLALRKTLSPTQRIARSNYWRPPRAWPFN